MRNGVTRRTILGGLMVSGAVGLGGCVTTTPSGSTNSTVAGGPDDDGLPVGTDPTEYADSATSSGVMVVVAREPKAPSAPISFGLLPASINGDAIEVADDDQLIRATVKAASSDDVREIRTFEVPPGTYILALTDFGKRGNYPGPRYRYPAPGYSTTYTPSPYSSAGGNLPPWAALAAIAIGVAAVGIQTGAFSRSGNEEEAEPIYDRDGNFRHHFVRDRKVVDDRAIVFTVTPGQVTYIGDFKAKLTPTGTRTLLYGYNADVPKSDEPPLLPTAYDVHKRPNDAVTAFYHAA